jgi:hypothetical protein
MVGEPIRAYRSSMTAAERPVLCRALIAAAGGEGRLAESLFATSSNPEESDGDEEGEGATRDIFDENLNDAARVVGWISNGMPSL